MAWAFLFFWWYLVKITKPSFISKERGQVFNISNPTCQADSYLYCVSFFIRSMGGQTLSAHVATMGCSQTLPASFFFSSPLAQTLSLKNSRWLSQAFNRCLNHSVLCFIALLNVFNFLKVRLHVCYCWWEVCVCLCPGVHMNVTKLWTKKVTLTDFLSNCFYN